jgi:hypothetical protein
MMPTPEDAGLNYPLILSEYQYYSKSSDTEIHELENGFIFTCRTSIKLALNMR